MFGSRFSTANVAAWPGTAFVSAEAIVVAKPSADASRRIVADTAPVPGSVTVPFAESRAGPPERNSPVPEGAPGARVVKAIPAGSPATPKEFVAESLA